VFKKQEEYLSNTDHTDKTDLLVLEIENNVNLYIVTNNNYLICSWDMACLWYTYYRAVEESIL